MKKALILMCSLMIMLAGCSKTEPEVEEPIKEETVTKHEYDWKNNNLTTSDVKVSNLSKENLEGVNTLSEDELKLLDPIPVYDEKDHADNGSGEAVDAKDVIKYNKGTPQEIVEAKPNLDKPAPTESTPTKDDKKPTTDNKLEITGTSVEF